MQAPIDPQAETFPINLTSIISSKASDCREGQHKRIINIQYCQSSYWPTRNGGRVSFSDSNTSPCQDTTPYEHSQVPLSPPPLFVALSTEPEKHNLASICLSLLTYVEEHRRRRRARMKWRVLLGGIVLVSAGQRPKRRDG